MKIVYLEFEYILDTFFDNSKITLNIEGEYYNEPGEEYFEILRALDKETGKDYENELGEFESKMIEIKAKEEFQKNDFDHLQEEDVVDL